MHIEIGDVCVIFFGFFDIFSRIHPGRRIKFIEERPRQSIQTPHHTYQAIYNAHSKCILLLKGG